MVQNTRAFGAALRSAKSGGHLAVGLFPMLAQLAATALRGRPGAACRKIEAFTSGDPFIGQAHRIFGKLLDNHGAPQHPVKNPPGIFVK